MVCSTRRPVALYDFCMPLVLHNHVGLSCRAACHSFLVFLPTPQHVLSDQVSHLLIRFCVQAPHISAMPWGCASISSDMPSKSHLLLFIFSLIWFCAQAPCAHARM